MVGHSIYFLEKKTCPIKFDENLKSVYKDQSPLTTTIRYWLNSLSAGRLFDWTSNFDYDPPGRPEGMVTKIHNVVLADYRVKTEENADSQNNSIRKVQNVHHGNLGMRKLSAIWVLRFLTLDENRKHLITSRCVTFGQV